MQVLESELLFDREGRTFYWHLPSTRTAGYIPGTWEVWQAMWENRHKMGGMAHTHPWNGDAWYSQEDVTTWSACDLGLGRRMVWVVVTFDQVAYYQWKGPGKYDYGIIQPDFRVEDIEELRRRSIVAG